MTIDLCFVSVSAASQRLAAFEALLTADERSRVLRYRAESEQRRAIVSRGALRQCLSRYVDGTVDIVQTPSGKPCLRGGGVEFNVSHSGDLIALAFADRAIGVDVERVRGMNGDAQQIAREHFSPEEVTRVSSASNPDDEFFAIWTAKEAVAKAIGIGLQLRLASFTVPPSSETFGAVRGCEPWWVRSVATPLAGYRAAIAVKGSVSERARVPLPLPPPLLRRCHCGVPSRRRRATLRA